MARHWLVLLWMMTLPQAGVALAQNPDPISGGGGWVGAGLLGAVLSWLLLKYLPEERAAMRQWVFDKENQLSHAEQQCRENMQRLVTELRDQAAKDRKEASDSQEKDRTIFRSYVEAQQRANDYHRRTSEQTIRMLEHLMRYQPGGGQSRLTDLSSGHDRPQEVDDASSDRG